MKKSKKTILLILSLVTLITAACSFSALPVRFSFFTDTDSEEPVVVVEEILALQEDGEIEDEDHEDADAPDTVFASDADIFDSLSSGIYEQVSPGVVYILVFTDYGSGSGSGFVYDKEGHIITNYHVIEGSTQIEVDFTSGRKVWAEVIATDTDSDLAVIKVDVPEDELFPLPLGSSEDLKVGDTVLAFGNPYGLVGTMTSGIVSAKGRTMESLRLAESGSFFSTGDVIQTDATINPGNSGGPLINLNGEVIGINRAIQTSGVSTTGNPINTGIGFAVSIDIVKRVVPVLIAEGSYDYPYLGISALESLNLLQQELLGIENQTGAYVTDVVQGSPADDAGVQGAVYEYIEYQGQQIEMPVNGDLLIGIDDEPVYVFGDLLSYLLLNKSPGDIVTLTVIRAGEEMQIDLLLGGRSAAH
ncbi:MAG: trypsin-like peptidase domain-containing protein [Anaerolineaceae bacterium]|nr:trypsin-like peptidase domain-containing protein [Anaerolineaceae bacterium]